MKLNLKFIFTVALLLAIFNSAHADNMNNAHHLTIMGAGLMVKPETDLALSKIKIAIEDFKKLPQTEPKVLLRVGVSNEHLAFWHNVSFSRQLYWNPKAVAVPEATFTYLTLKKGRMSVCTVSDTIDQGCEIVSDKTFDFKNHTADITKINDDVIENFLALIQDEDAPLDLAMDVAWGNGDDHIDLNSLMITAEGSDDTGNPAATVDIGIQTPQGKRFAQLSWKAELTRSTTSDGTELAGNLQYKLNRIERNKK